MDAEEKHKENIGRTVGEMLKKGRKPGGHDFSYIDSHSFPLLLYQSEANNVSNHEH